MGEKKIARNCLKWQENCFLNLTCVRKKNCQKMENTKVARNCLKWRENCSKMFLEIVDYFYFLWQVWEGGRSALGEAVAHALPARRGARSTPRATPLWSLLALVARTFFYCVSQESQQRGKTPKLKTLIKIFKKLFRKNFRQFRATLFFSTFWQFFFLTQVKK